MTEWVLLHLAVTATNFRQTKERMPQSADIQSASELSNIYGSLIVFITVAFKKDISVGNKLVIFQKRNAWMFTTVSRSDRYFHWAIY